MVASVREALRETKLQTRPDFEVVYIDSEVELTPIADTAGNSNAEQAVSSLTQEDTHNGSTPVASGSAAKDPVPRIGMLVAANQQPTSVNRDAEVCEAVTLMMLNDFSQLPVCKMNAMLWAWCHGSQSVEIEV